MAAGRVHDLAGNQPLEGQVGQNVRNLYSKRVGDELDTIGRHVTTAGFPICNNTARYRRAKGMQPSREFLLGNSLPFPNVADTSSDWILDFWFHT